MVWHLLRPDARHRSGASGAVSSRSARRRTVAAAPGAGRGVTAIESNGVGTRTRRARLGVRPSRCRRRLSVSQTSAHASRRRRSPTTRVFCFSLLVTRILSGPARFGIDAFLRSRCLPRPAYLRLKRRQLDCPTILGPAVFGADPSPRAGTMNASSVNTTGLVFRRLTLFARAVGFRINPRRLSGTPSRAATPPAAPVRHDAPRARQRARRDRARVPARVPRRPPSRRGPLPEPPTRARRPSLARPHPSRSAHRGVS